MRRDAESNDELSSHIFASIDPKIKELLEASTEIRFEKFKSKQSMILEIDFDEDKIEPMKTSQTKKVRINPHKKNKSLIGKIEEEKE